MKHRVSILCVMITAAFLSISYQFSSHQSEASKKPVLPFPDTANHWVDSVYRSLSRDERIAQLLIVPAYSGRNNAYIEDLQKLIRKHKIGGVVFFQGGPERQLRMTNRLQEDLPLPLLVAMDAEWGLNMRLDSTMVYPRQLMLGAVDDDSLVWKMGYDLAGQLKRIGVHMNFAPVIDINSNPDHPVMNTRSFGENKHHVAGKGLMYARGMHDNGVLCVAKHFPGHGETDADSHDALPILRHSYNRLRSVELYPFRECIAGGLPGIMTGHISLPEVDIGEGLPASLSPKIITDLLRNKMGFNGLVITDAMNMKGVTQAGRPGEIEAGALIAGNDLLLMPSDVSKTIHAVRREIRRGNLSWTDIEKKCKRMLAAKKWLGLDDWQPSDTADIQGDLHLPSYELTRSRLVEQSLTLLANQDGLIPVSRLDQVKVLSVAVGTDTANAFQEYLQLYTSVTQLQLADEPDRSSLDALSESIADHDLVIVSLHRDFQRRGLKFPLSSRMIEYLQEMAETTRLVVTVFANPYVLKHFGDPTQYAGLIMAYEDSELSQRFAAQMIFGGIPALGRLPVSSGRFYREGDGLTTRDHFRFKYSIPEEVNIDSRQLRKIDSIAGSAIAVEATPGCQVLVARNGVVVYHKAFGHHTYAGKRPVRLSDIYDLASVTKITSTLPCLMKLVDEERIDINRRLADYLPLLDTTNKDSLVIKEVLSHKSGLQAWIPFYLSTIETMNPREPLISRRMSSRNPIRLNEFTFVNRNTRYKDGIYSRSYSDIHPIKVADHLYMRREYRDTIFSTIYRSALLEKREYVYSDLGYFLFMQMIEEMTDSTLYEYVYHNFYKHLGALTLGFLPLNRFPRDRVVPTENDIVFRRQLLRGHVHDMGAAQLGGVCGHAGLFSNANDLAKIMQMYLQGGHYAGRRYLSEETIDLFNTCHYCGEGIRRGLGFDKPDPEPDEESIHCRCVSKSSFGHFGFTGTMAWADPENGVLYVFLSNRVHPDQDNTKLYDLNVRTNIQQVVYDAIMDPN